MGLHSTKSITFSGVNINETSLWQMTENNLKLKFELLSSVSAFKKKLLALLRGLEGQQI